MRALVLGLLVLSASLGGCNENAHEVSPYFEEVLPSAPSDAPDAGGLDRRAPLPAPLIAMTPTGRARFAALPARPGRIPVLLFHEVCPGVCGPASTYGISQADLMKMLLAIGSAGFTTISIDAYARAMRGQTAGLPERPILVTFDDGRLDAYRGADDVLRVLGAKATMYLITNELGKKASSYPMSTAEIETAFASGRWDMQLHAHAGHVFIEAGPSSAGAPTMMPFYAARRSLPKASGAERALEPFGGWKNRAAEDLAEGKALIAAYFGGYRYASLTFAVPYGDYGQKATNDPAIAPDLRATLDSHFEVWFTQPPDPDFTGPPSGPTATHEAGRFTVQRETTVEAVYDWLARRSSGR